MTSIVAFLLSRIAEDEGMAEMAAARQGAEWTSGQGPAFGPLILAGPFYEYPHTDVAGDVDKVRAAATHVAGWDPARVIAECGAKRRIVELYSDEAQFLVQRGFVGFRGSETLRLLALPYAGHPDYQQKWAV